MAVPALQSGAHLFVASMAAYVGLDPNKDINIVVHPPPEAKELLAEGRIDALIGFPPDPQELRARKIGHVVVNTMMDRPWSQYYCCTVSANREFFQRYPAATRRVLRAILKGSDICAREPERAARFLVDRGYITNYAYALEAMQQIPYGLWREYDPEDTLRFYSLRLQEAGMIKSGPNTIIDKSADWRFLNDLKQELKA